MELETIKMIGEAGLAGVFVVAIFVLWKLGKQMLALVCNHLHHNTTPLTELDELIRESKEYTKDDRYHMHIDMYC